MSKDGLCAIVTGSASGLGAATAQILAQAGARIVVNYSNSKAEAEATAELCRKAGAEVVVVQGDVSRDEDCKKIAAVAAPRPDAEPVTIAHKPSLDIRISSYCFETLFEPALACV